MDGQHQELFLPIHGYVRFTSTEIEVINHPAFQRLRRTRQLGFAHIVFPGAVHTRFEHSLGTVHVAQRIIDHVNQNCERGHNPRDVRPIASITRAHKDLIRVAALLHDIGHLPYGHTLEDELGHLAPHDGLSRLEKISSRTYPGYAPSDWVSAQKPKLISDGQWSLENLIDVLYKDVVSLFDIDEPPFAVVRAIISKSPKNNSSHRAAWEEQREDLNRKFNLDLCRDIVGNTICADFLDYLHRDWYHLGKPLYEETRIYQYMEARQALDSTSVPFSDGSVSDLEFVINIGSGEKIRHDALTSILELLEGRYKLAETVLFHRTKLAVTGLLDRCLLEIANLYEQANIPTDRLETALEQLLLDASDDMLPELLQQLTTGRGLTDVRTSLKASIAAGKHEAGKSLGKTDDLLTSMPLQEETNIESILESRQQSIMSLIDRLKHRSVYRMLYKLKLSDFPASHGPETPGPNKVLSMYQDNESRRGFLEGLERLCGLPEYSLVMYCPPVEMNAKIAKVKLLIEDQVIRFDKYDSHAKESSLTRGALWSHIDRFSELWSTQIFLHRNVWDGLSTSTVSESHQNALMHLRNVVSTFLVRLNQENDASIQRMNVDSSIQVVRKQFHVPLAARHGTVDPRFEAYEDFIFPSGLSFAMPDA